MLNNYDYISENIEDQDDNENEEQKVSKFDYCEVDKN